jgi:hypothetical protein
MVEQEAGKRIYNWKRQWRILRLLQLTALSLGFSPLVCAVLVNMFPFADWETVIFVSLFLIAFVTINLIHPFWKIDAPGISRYLDRQFPELEESTGILLRPFNELSLLERLQQQKIKTLLTQIQTPAAPLKNLGLSILAMIIGFGFSFMIYHLKPLGYAPEAYPHEDKSTTVIKERIPAQIASFSLKISAPAYTGLPERKQQQFSVKAATGSLLKWEIRTNEPVKKLRLIFNDREVASLRSIDGLGTEWRFLKTIHQPGFYQVELDGKKSDLYQLELIPDLPVSIRIIQPKPHTTMDFGQPQRLNLTLHLNDDYGIRDASISATMASGKGEGVSFTEKKLLFNTSFNNSKSMSLSKTLDLKFLGMKPGDELYFFVKALDNHGQTSRSDVYFVSIVDTAELMSMAGMTNGINLVPEYFRSQRQIIMDTEKLLDEQPKITEESFKNRSNALGIDQRLLRLRYGKFLGEETETEIGADHDHEEGHAHEEGHQHEGEEHHEAQETKTTEKFGDVKAIMDSYSHKHDIAEDATFFEPELKAQLKAVLTEMWSSELHLRTYKTRDALPFEYKALRLLKDLQQKSRAYVAKTTVKVAQLKEEKRLSGELDKIGQPLQKNTFEPLDKKSALLKRALSALESRKTGAVFKTEELTLLRETEKYMVVAASDNPAVFLPALKEWRKLMTGSGSSEKEIAKVQGAIGKMIGQEQAVPQLPSALPASNLYRKYFNALKKGEGANGI